jgi:hypothetical protein
VDGAASADLSMLQCASYTLEMLSHGGLRSHVISALVTDDTIRLLYYDRSIIIVSRPVNFLEDPSRFIAMLHAIANLTLPQVGYADVVKPAPLLDNPRQTTDIFDGLELRLSDGTRLLFGSTIFHQHGIIGRGTCVVRARRVEKGKYSGTDDDAWDGPLIVKLSWPAKSRILFVLSVPPRRTAQFESFGRWVVPMQKMMRDGFSARTEYISEVGLAESPHLHPFEHETLGGFVTFDKFQAILNTKLQ